MDAQAFLERVAGRRIVNAEGEAETDGSFRLDVLVLEGDIQLDFVGSDQAGVPDVWVTVDAPSSK